MKTTSETQKKGILLTGMCLLVLSVAVTQSAYGNGAVVVGTPELSGEGYKKPAVDPESVLDTYSTFGKVRANGTDVWGETMILLPEPKKGVDHPCTMMFKGVNMPDITFIFWVTPKQSGDETICEGLDLGNMKSVKVIIHNNGKISWWISPIQVEPDADKK